MPDREKVIKGLECCTTISLVCEECPYKYKKTNYLGTCIAFLFGDILELLKEHEPVEPKRTVDKHGQVLSCGNCGAWFEVQHQKYCHECGRPVRWDD